MTKPDDVYEQANTGMKDYVDSVEPIQKLKKPRRNKRTILLVVLILLLAAAAVWFFLIRKPDPIQPSQNTGSENQPAENPEEETVTTTEEHVSQNFRLTLSYPTNWRVDETDPAQLLVYSPVTRVKSVNNKQADIRAVVRIRAKGSALAEFTENSVAIRASEKIAYAQPSAQQRGQTYLTFASHRGNGLEGVYITGDNGYEKDGFVPKADVVQADPIVSVSFFPCADEACDPKDPEGIGIVESEWEDNKFLQQAKTLLQSLVIS